MRFPRAPIPSSPLAPSQSNTTPVRPEPVEGPPQTPFVLSLSKDRPQTPFVLSLSKDRPQTPFVLSLSKDRLQTPFVLSLSKDRPQCRTQLFRSWFDRLTTNGIMSPVRPEPAEGPPQTPFVLSLSKDCPQTPFVLSLSKDRPQCRTRPFRSWFDRLTTNGIMSPVRPEPVEGRCRAPGFDTPRPNGIESLGGAVRKHRNHASRVTPHVSKH